jgi:hypothetical protein
MTSTSKLVALNPEFAAPRDVLLVQLVCTAHSTRLVVRRDRSAAGLEFAAKGRGVLLALRQQAQFVQPPALDAAALDYVNRGKLV